MEGFVHRVLFFKGEPYEIYSYGFMLVVAMALGVAYMVARGPRYGLTRDQVLDYALAVLLGGMIGARLFMVFDDMAYYAQQPWQILNIRGGGLAWHGAIIGGVLGFLAYHRRSGVDCARLLDLVVPPMVLGHIAGRIGCFLNGCCVGRPTDVPWAATFPDAPEWQHVPRHPTQLYEALAEVATLLFLTLWWERRMGWRGSMIYVYLCIYGTVRFIVDFYRQEPLLYGGLDEAQYVSIGLILIGAFGLWRVSHRAWAPQAPPKEEVNPAG